MCVGNNMNAEKMKLIFFWFQASKFAASYTYTTLFSWENLSYCALAVTLGLKYQFWECKWNNNELEVGKWSEFMIKKLSLGCKILHTFVINLIVFLSHFWFFSAWIDKYVLIFRSVDCMQSLNHSWKLSIVPVLQVCSQDLGQFRTWLHVAQYVAFAPGRYFLPCRVLRINLFVSENCFEALDRRLRILSENWKILIVVAI